MRIQELHGAWERRGGGLIILDYLINQDISPHKLESYSSFVIMEFFQSCVICDTRAFPCSTTAFII